MAKILIVEDDGLVAQHMAQTLREAGHTPVLAADERSALQEVADRPDVILLDLGLSGLSGETLLTQLKSHLDIAPIPVLVVAKKRDAAAPLRDFTPGWVVDILPKPVSSAQLRQAVEAVLAKHQEGETEETLEKIHEQQCQLIQRLIVEGSDALVFQTCRRLSSDRTRGRGSRSGDALSWTEITQWAKHEGLLDAEQAKLLRRMPATRLEVLQKGVA